MQDIGDKVLENQANSAFILNILENLGRLPHDFDGTWLLKLLDSESSTVRFLAVKNYVEMFKLVQKIKNSRTRIEPLF